MQCTRIIIHRFPDILVLVSYGEIGFKKNCIGQALTWISGLKVPLLPLGPSCHLQTILLSDLVGCDSPLQKVMAFWCTFFKFEACQTAIIVCSWLLHQTQQVQILKKVRQMAILICSRPLYLTGWASQSYENISRRFFHGQRNPLRI